LSNSRLINKIREAGRIAPVKYQGNAYVPLVAQDNIDMFNKAVVEYGVPEDAAFPSLDLYEAHKGTFVNVITCLNKLGFEVTPFKCRVEVTYGNDFVYLIEVVFVWVSCVCYFFELT